MDIFLRVTYPSHTPQVFIVMKGMCSLMSVSVVVYHFTNMVCHNYHHILASTASGDLE